MLDVVAPRWLADGLFPEGRAIDAFDAKGRPIVGATRMRVQGRALFAYSVLAWIGLDAARAKADAAMAYLAAHGWCADGLRPVLGGEGGAEGAPRGDATLYDHACVALALAWRWRASGDAAALAGWARIQAILASQAHRDGGWHETWPRRDGVRLQNPHMHLFEAALAWRGTERGADGAEALLEGLFRLLRDRMMDSKTGTLRERFAPGWRDGCDECAGHLWEWSSLLRLWRAPAGEALARRLEARARALGEAALGSRAWAWMERARALRLAPNAEAESVAAWQAFVARRVAGAPAGLWLDGTADGRVSASGIYHVVSCFAHEANAGR